MVWEAIGHGGQHGVERIHDMEVCLEEHVISVLHYVQVYQQV